MGLATGAGWHVIDQTFIVALHKLLLIMDTCISDFCQRWPRQPRLAASCLLSSCVVHNSCQLYFMFYLISFASSEFVQQYYTSLTCLYK